MVSGIYHWVERTCISTIVQTYHIEVNKALYIMDTEKLCQRDTFLCSHVILFKLLYPESAGLGSKLRQYVYSVRRKKTCLMSGPDELVRR